MSAHEFIGWVVITLMALALVAGLLGLLGEADGSRKTEDGGN